MNAMNGTAYIAKVARCLAGIVAADDEDDDVREGQGEAMVDGRQGTMCHACNSSCVHNLHMHLQLFCIGGAKFAAHGTRVDGCMLGLLDYNQTEVGDLPDQTCQT